MGKRWNNDEIDFLKENYSKNSAIFCSLSLNRSLNSIRIKASCLNLQNKITLFRKNKNIDTFININTKETSYVLGLLWADGYLTKNYISIEANKNDLLELEHILYKISIWCKYDRTKRNVLTYMINNRELCKYLHSFDYSFKSLKSPDKILNIIPEKLKKYFIRGWIDGDGCFYFYKKEYIRQFSLSGAYNTDWSYFENLCKNLNIKYNIKRVFNTKTSYSVVRISNKNDIKKLGDLIYDDYLIDKMGLYRKYLKYLNCII